MDQQFWVPLDASHYLIESGVVYERHNSVLAQCLADAPVVGLAIGCMFDVLVRPSMPRFACMRMSDTQDTEFIYTFKLQWA